MRGESPLGQTVGRLGRYPALAGKALSVGEFRLLPSIGHVLCGQVVFLAGQLAMLVALTRLRGAEAVGEFGLALALTTPFFMLVSMAGQTSQASDVRQRYSFAEYAGLAVGLSVLALIGSILAGLAFGSSEQAIWLITVIACTKAVEAVSTLSYGAFHQAGRTVSISGSMLIRAAVAVPAFVALIWAGVPLPAAFLVQLAVWGAVAVLRDYPLASRIAAGGLVWPSRDFRRVSKLARETAPLGASFGIGALLNSLPRLYVERSLGLSAVGVLTIVTYFQQAGSVVLSSISRPLVNMFARLRHGGSKSDLRRSVAVLAAFVALASLVLVLGAALAGRWILETLFGPELASADDLLLIIALALSLKLFAILPQSLLHADRRYLTFLLREIAAVLVCFALLALLVPAMGLNGAGYAILGAVLFRLVAMVAAFLLPGRREKRTAGSRGREAVE